MSWWKPYPNVEPTPAPAEMPPRDPWAFENFAYDWYIQRARTATLSTPAEASYPGGELIVLYRLVAHQDAMIRELRARVDALG